MANLITNWLNYELKLSKKIETIEEDFANGYLFGEILYKSKIINNLKDFKNKFDIDNKLNNFRIIEKTFKELAIKFDQTKIDDVLNKKRGVATKYLYQLKMALAKKEISFEDILNKKSPKAIAMEEISNRTLQPFIMKDIEIPAPPNFSMTLNTMKNKTVINPLLTDYNPVNRFEKFQRQQEKLIKIHNDFQESILKNEKNPAGKNNFKSIDEDLFTNFSEISNEKKPLKLIEEEKIEKENDKIIVLQKVNPEEEELLQEMRNQSTLYNSKIMESLNLKEKNNIVNLDNFEKNIINLGLELSYIDPKLKKLSKSKIGKDLLLKKIKGRVKEASEMNFFKDSHLSNPIGGSFKTHNPNDFFGRFKPAVSIGNLNMESEPQLQKKKKFLHPIEKRNEYEEQRSLIERTSIRKKKLKVHEVEIKRMNSENNKLNSLNQIALNPSSSLSLNPLSDKKFITTTKNLPKINNNSNRNLWFEKTKEDLTLPQRQMELTKKVKKRKKNKIILSQIANYMIDLVEEIYIYQTEKTDSKIYLDDWRTWSAMFINNEPFARAQKINLEYFERINSTNEEKQSHNNSRSDLSDSMEMNLIKDFTYEETELMNYLTYRGRFVSSIIPESELGKILDFFEIMGADYVPKSLDNNNYKSKTMMRNYREYEPKDDDLTNLAIPKELQRNIMLTEIIEIMFDLKFYHNNNNTEESINANLENYNSRNNILLKKSSDQTNNNIRKVLFKHIPIKICFMGNSFSGKKTQAKLLSEKYKLKIYNIEEIIKTYFETLDALSIPIEENPNYKILKKIEIDKLISDREKEEQKIEPYKPLLLNLKKILKNSNSSFQKDEAVIELLIEVIKQDFPEQPYPQYLEEIKKKHIKLREINEEIRRLKDESQNQSQNQKPLERKLSKTSLKNDKHLLEEKIKIEYEANKGFIILDFPNTIQQAQIFERKLTGYFSELEKNESEYSKSKYDFSLVCDVSNKIPNKTHLTESGLNLCIHFEGNSKELIRRSQNRKMDSITGIIYHNEDNPILTEEKKITERLLLAEEFTPKESDILDTIKKNNLETFSIMDFYSKFGYEKMNFKFFNKLQIYEKANFENHGKDYTQQINAIFNEINNLVGNLIKINTQKEIEIILQSNKQDKETDRHLTNIIPSVNSSVILESQNEIMDSQTERKSASLRDYANTSKNNMALNALNSLNEKNDKNENIITENIDTNTFNNLNNQVQNLDEDDFNKYNKKLMETKKKMNTSLIEEIFGKWKISSDNYVNNLYSIFRKLKKQKEILVTNYTKLQNMFVDFLKRPSKKNLELVKFVSKYNKFLDEYPELGCDDLVISEFKQDLADISDRIWEYIEERKIEAIKERKKIISIGFIDKEIEKFYQHVEKVFFFEAEKLEISLAIIRQFYATMDSNTFHELSKFNAVEILKEELNTITGSSNFNFEKGKIKKDENQLKIAFLKLDRLYKNSIRMILLYDDLLKAQKKKVKFASSKSNISLDITKKTFHHGQSYRNKRNNNETTFMEDKKEIFIYEEELKNSIKSENNKFKYRITFLKNWAKNMLLNMKKLSDLVYENFDAWIIKSIKAENDSMNNILSYMENSIENQQKVKLDMELDSFDIYDFVKIEEFFEIEKKNTEEVKDNKTNFKKFFQIFEAVKKFEVYPNYIRTTEFYDVFIHKYLLNNEKKDLDVPKILKNLSFFELKRYVTNFKNIPLTDKTSSGNTVYNK